MKVVRSNAKFHVEKCTGCKTCTHVCPTLAFRADPEPSTKRFRVAPCASRCPVGNDVEGFIRLVGQKRYLEAYTHILKTNPFPGVTGRVCHAPCEGSCNRADLDKGVSIQALERFVADRAMREDYRVAQPAVSRQERVSIIGSGPAGLACAYDLARSGYRVTVFEAEERLGGMLWNAIPEYRLPRKIVEWEINHIRSSNLEIRLNHRLGENLTLRDLKEFDAVYIATGLQQSLGLGIPGEDSQGVWRGLDFLKRVRKGEEIWLGQKVAVIGGGNSAVDAARCALRLGAQPILLYRKSLEDMPASVGEKEELMQEGVQIVPFAAPKRIVAEQGKVRHIECRKTAPGEATGEKRRGHFEGRNSGFILQVDSVIEAIGESPDFSVFPSSLKVKRNRILVDRSGATGCNGFFAGGSIAPGVETVSEAIASGKKGALAIHRYLKREAAEKKSPGPLTITLGELNPEFFSHAERMRLSNLDPASRASSFVEVRLGCHEEGAVREARRCLGCGAPPLYDREACRGCSNCQQRCTASAITIERSERPSTVGVDVEEVDRERILSICVRAKMHPEQTVCYCTSTTAGEIAAAILKGATTPEAISLMTGARTGCTVLCAQSIFKLLKASGQTLAPGETHQWYAEAATVWEVDEKTKRRYEDQGYRFEEDIGLLKKVFDRS